ncbi:C80 family cysteine peptidase [Burkholderia ubonensis]|uniref:two-partner secretion domain-containing protein n=1 Tax=Burkholderia ubonensis TaxID=101571 RepID=UPI0009B4CB1E|nr:C80 family cysteine peptidase [Burkholderia ubonensis]
MNQQAYKIKFSRRLGTWVAVSELTRGASKGSGGATGGSGEGRRSGFGGGLKRLVMTLAVGGLLPGLVEAQVVADGSRGPGVQVVNGAPVVNIATPNERGVSRNAFTEFNVGQPGVVLNNSATAGQSVLAGAVAGNAQLRAGQEARAIVAEVTGSKASLLQGTLEVRGQRADVIVANPNGITLNGVSTINARGLTATTGQARLDPLGRLGFEVEQGKVVVGPQGVDTKGLEYVDLVARSVELNGAIGSQAGNRADVRVVAGLNRLDEETGGLVKLQDKADGAPQYGIEGTALGAMYGGHIRLASTESGVGVRHVGTILSADAIRISSNGDVTVGGPVRGEGDVALQTAGTVTNQGGITSDGAVTVVGRDVENRAWLAGKGDVRIGAQRTIKNQSVVWAGRDVTATAEQAIVNEGDIKAGRDLTLSVGERKADGSLQGGTIRNEASGRLFAQRDMALDAKQIFNEAKLSGEARAQRTTSLETYIPTVAGGAYDDYHDARHEHYSLGVVGLKDYDATGDATQVGLRASSGAMEVGGDLRVNQAGGKGQGGTLTNRNGLMLVGRDMVVDGNFENLALSQQHTLADRLTDTGAVRLEVRPWTNIGTPLSNETTRQYANLYAFLETTLHEPGASHQILGAYSWNHRSAIETLKQAANNAPRLQALLSQALGPDWQAHGIETLSKRWSQLKPREVVVQTFYPDKAAEVVVGGDLRTQRGRWVNGVATAPEQWMVQVQIGDRQVWTTQGQLDAKVNHGDGKQVWSVQDALPRLQALGYLKAGADQAGGPLYESQTSVADQTQWDGWAEFRQLVQGPAADWDPTKEAFRLHDWKAHASLASPVVTTALIDQTVKQAVGGWFAKTKNIQGEALERRLVHDASRERTRLGLQPGRALNAQEVAQLQRDIVWYEPESVAGRMVWVPKVYLTQATLARQTPDAPVMWSGPDVLWGPRSGPVQEADQPASRGGMWSGPDILSGPPRAPRQDENPVRAVAATAGGAAGKTQVAGSGRELERASASIVAQGKIDGKADQDGVKNVNGEIVGQQGVRLETEGSVKNVAGAGITGRVSSGQGTVELTTRGAVQNEGARIDGRTVAIQGNRFESSAGPGLDAQGRQVIRNAATVASQERVTIVTTGDTVLRGAQVQGGDVSINSQGKLISKDVQVVDARSTSTTRQGWLGYEHREQMQASARSVGSEIAAAQQGGTLSLQGQQGVELVGGHYSADHGQIVSSQGDVVTKAGQHVEADKQSLMREQFIIGASSGLPMAGATIGYGSVTGAQMSPESGGSLVSGQFGYERTTAMDATQRVTHQNAQLEFGRDIKIGAGGAADIGGADIKAARQGQVSVSGKEVRTTKAVDETVQTHRGSETFVGVQLEGHSSIVNTINGATKLIQASQAGQSVDPGLTTLQAVGHVTDLAFNDTVGGSKSVTIKYTQTNETSRASSETVNHVQGGTVKIQSTGGDVTLAGVKVQGDQVAVDSAGGLAVRSAQTQSSRSWDSQSHQVSYTESAGANAVMQQAYASASVGYTGSLDNGAEQKVTHQSSVITGDQVTVQSKGDTTLSGARVDGRQVKLEVGEALKVESAQDRHQQTHESGRWGATAGAAMGILADTPYVAPVFSVQGGYGKDYDNGQQIAQRSGVRATERLDATVGRDLQLTAAALASGTGAGQVKVAGKTVAQTLEDTRDKDGGSGGGSAGFGKDGLVNVTLDGGRVSHVHYRATQASGVDVKDFEPAGGVEGALQRDSGSLTQVTRDERIVGNDISLTLEDPRGQVKRKKGGGEADDAGGVKKPAGTEDGYTKRVIVQQGEDPTVAEATQRLVNKHPDNTVVVKAGADGQLVGLEQLPAAPGKVKVQVVGHGDAEGGTLGDANARKLAQQIEQVKGRLGEDAQVKKVTLVGCRTACASEAGQPSLTAQVQTELAQQGSDVGEVKGTQTLIKVDKNGRKAIADDNDRNALINLPKLAEAAQSSREHLPTRTNQISSTSAEAIVKLGEDRANPEMAAARSHGAPQGIQDIIASGVGNCGECAAVTLGEVIAHGALDPGDAVSIMSGKYVDHAYTKIESVDGSSPSYIIDTWPNEIYLGPASSHAISSGEDHVVTKIERSGNGNLAAVQAGSYPVEIIDWKDLVSSYRNAITSGENESANNMDWALDPGVAGAIYRGHGHLYDQQSARR